MTTLVYAEKNGVGYLACDSQSSTGQMANPDPINKLLTIDVNGVSVIASAGEARFLHIWKDLAEDFAESVAAFHASEGELELEDTNRLIRSLQEDFVGYVMLNIPDVATYFEKVNGVAMSPHVDGGSKGVNGAFLMASEKHGCFSVDSCLSMDKVSTYACEGSGSVFAAGALEALYHAAETEEDLRDAVLKAVDVAKRLDPYSGGETRVVKFDMSEARTLEELNHVEITDELIKFAALKHLMEKEEKENADKEEEKEQ